MKGYVILGDSGEYSDKSWWVVAAYSEREVAEFHLKCLEEWAENWVKRKQNTWERPIVGSNPFDPNMEDDRHGPTYTLIETRHFLHVDEIKEAAGL